MADNPRIEELRRRVQADPASIAFAALAEEYRRVGRNEDAIATCRTGLVRHPAYLSARVTLGRALIETGEFDAARKELETVLRSAPENIAATRGLALIAERMGQSATMDPGLAAIAEASIPAAPPQRPGAPEPRPAARTAVPELSPLRGTSSVGLDALDVDLSAPAAPAQGEDAFDLFAEALERSAGPAAPVPDPPAAAPEPTPLDPAPVALDAPVVVAEVAVAEEAVVAEPVRVEEAQAVAEGAVNQAVVAEAAVAEAAVAEAAVEKAVVEEAVVEEAEEAAAEEVGIVEDAPGVSGPIDPAAVAALGRLERMLGAIRTARHA